MRVDPIHDRRRGGSAFDAALEQLVLATGSAEFEPQLFASARAATGCEHLTAYTYTEATGPNLVVAANPGKLPIAREAGQVYVSQFWDRDPGNGIIVKRRADNAGLLIRASGDEIRRSDFRQGCYTPSSWERTGNRMIDRVSIVKLQRERVVKISFHRAEWAGLFSDTEIANIVDVANLLTALVARHDDASAGSARPAIASPDDGVHEDYVEAVSLACPQLTRREAEICASIVRGVTSEGMALDLDISINTVRTYRKRAYGRLNISSQNELMKLVLPHVGLH